MAASTKSESYRKPLPLPDEVSHGFWDAAKRGELALQYCQQCSIFLHPPKPRCPHCFQERLEWRRISGRGRIHTYGIVYHRGGVRGFEDEVPYIIALVEVEEQERVFLTTNIVDCSSEEVAVDLPVQAIFDAVTDDVTLVKFKPRQEGQP